MSHNPLVGVAEGTAENSAGKGECKATGKTLRMSWVWLLTSVVLGCFSSGHWVVPLLAWLGPPFVMRFMAAQPNWRGNLGVIVAGYIVFWVTQRGIIPMSPPEFAIAGVVAALIGLLPYWIYRRIQERFSGFWITLTFPAMIVFIEYVLVQGPFGSWGSLATTQYRNIFFLQILALFGTSGLVFLMSWVGAAMDWFWKESFDWKRIQVPLWGTVATLGIVFMYGICCVYLFPIQVNKLRVAGIVAQESAFRSEAIVAMIRRIRSGSTITEEELKKYKDSRDKRIDDLLKRCEEGVSQNAKYIYMSEAAVVVLKEDEAEVLKRFQDFAKEQRVYIGVAMAAILKQQQGPFVENKLFLFSPMGELVNQYQKNLIPPGEPSIPGKKVPAKLQSPYGLMSQVICFDTDFPALMREPGRFGAGVVFAPSNDWKEAAEPHLAVAALRSVENRYTLVRITSEGVSAVIDPMGRIVHEQNSFESDHPDFVWDVPTGKGLSLYSIIGDILPMMSGVIVLATVIVAFVPKRILQK